MTQALLGDETHGVSNVASRGKNGDLDESKGGNLATRTLFLSCSNRILSTSAESDQS